MFLIQAIVSKKAVAWVQQVITRAWRKLSGVSGEGGMAHLGHLNVFKNGHVMGWAEARELFFPRKSAVMSWEDLCLGLDGMKCYLIQESSV